MPNPIILIFIIISVFIIYSPVYLQRRKNWRIADEDLKKIDYEEWKKQLKSNVYINLISRVLWGLMLVSGFIFNLQKVGAPSFNWTIFVILALGVSFIVWGILGFRLEMRKVNEIK